MSTSELVSGDYVEILCHCCFCDANFYDLLTLYGIEEETFNNFYGSLKAAALIIEKIKNPQNSIFLSTCPSLTHLFMTICP